jgi:hypothetical protein
MIYMFTSVISSMGRNTRCHHLWLWLRDEYEAYNWSATLIPLMYLVYVESTGNVGISSWTAPFLQGTSSRGIHGNQSVRHEWIGGAPGVYPSSLHKTCRDCHAWSTHILAHIFFTTLHLPNVKVDQYGYI